LLLHVTDSDRGTDPLAIRRAERQQVQNAELETHSGQRQVPDPSDQAGRITDAVWPPAAIKGRLESGDVLAVVTDGDRYTPRQVKAGRTRL
jgi:hypothetical protein